MTSIHRLATALAFPAVLAHEGAHWAVGRWGAREDRLVLAGARPRYEVHEWADGAAWVLVAAAYAPLVAGLVLAGGVLSWALLTGWAPDSFREWCIVTLGAGWWAVFVTPSPGDIAAAQEGIDRARE